jgi:phosphoglycolate phosphatase-like HAD superfamily hydrolase
MKLLLFDIDGTLLTTDGAGRVALRLAAKDVFGLDEDLSGVTIAGNTDTGIIRELLAKRSLPITDGNVNRYIGGYLARLRDQLAESPGIILPGISVLLDTAATIGWTIGLLTGNVERGAQLKLATHGINHYFSVGAFGDDHHDRNELGPIAKRRAENFSNTRFAETDIYVIGDTPRDITCGRSFGARTIAVATGSFAYETLQQENPDFLFKDFSDTEEVLKTIRGSR